MKEIQLTMGMKAFVDDEDFERVCKYNWFCIKNKADYKYAGRRVYLNDKKTITVFLHQELLGLKGKCAVLFKDKNSLNCCKDNIRLSELSDIHKNMRMSKRNNSGFLGVFYNKRTKKWRAMLASKNKNIYLGEYANKSDAILARKQGNIEYGFAKNHGKIFPENKKLTGDRIKKRERITKNTKFNIVGVTFNKKAKKYRAQLNFNGEPIYLGQFDTIFEASCARKEAENKYWNNL